MNDPIETVPRWGLLMVMAALLAACATLEVNRAPRGDLPGLVKAQRDTERPDDARPLALLFGDFEVWAIDPISEARLWTRGYQVVGQPAADPDHVYLPVSGQRVVALDRQSGAQRWSVTFEGEIVSGLAANGSVVVVTSTDGRRSYAAGYDAVGGSLLWAKHSDGGLGVPVLVGKVAVVPLAGQALVLGQMTGRERARADLPFPATHWSIARRQADAVVVGGEDGFVDLLRPRAAPRRFSGTHGAIHRSFARMDPGHDDGERLRWWAPVPQDGGPPETAVFMARRAVVGVHLDDRGRPDALRWIHLAPADDEHVTMEVSYGRVNLVRESGALVALSTEDGRMFALRPGDPDHAGEVRGAALLDHDQFFALGDRSIKAGDAAAIERIYLEPEVDLDERVARLFEDADPRLWPAQALAVEVAAATEDVNTFEAVLALARGETRGDSDGVSPQLRALAQREVARRSDFRPSAGALSSDPVAGVGEVPELAMVARDAVRRGDVSAVDELAAHLLHPNTPARDLDAVAEALCALDQPVGTQALAEFVRLYHADPEAAIESDALSVAVSCLSGLVEREPIARETLDLVRRDPFTDPSVRDYMDEAGVAVMANGPEPTEPTEPSTSPKSQPSPSSPPQDHGPARPSPPRPPTLPDSGL